MKHEQGKALDWLLHPLRRGEARAGTANCRLTTYKVCDPNHCPWYKNRKMQEASFEKARQNYMKNHGGKDEYYAMGYGPKDWRGQKARDWEKEDEANDGTH